MDDGRPYRGLSTVETKEPRCFCGANEWSGDGRYVTLLWEGKVRAVKRGWASQRQISGYLETCDTCFDKAVTDEDGTALRFIRETDTIQEA